MAGEGYSGETPWPSDGFLQDVRPEEPPPAPDCGCVRAHLCDEHLALRKKIIAERIRYLDGVAGPDEQP